MADSVSKNHGEGAMKQRSRSIIRAEALWRLICLSILSRKYSSILLTEYPKSGGSWLCQILGETLDLEFPRNRFPTIGPNIYHGHYLKRFDTVPTVVMWRDPRDIMVSWYYHTVVGHEMTHSSIVNQTRSSLDFTDVMDIQRNMERFIHYTFTEQKSPGFNWNDFFDFWIDPGNNKEDVYHTSYENLKSDTNEAVTVLLKKMGYSTTPEKISSAVEKFTFRNQSNRSEGEEKSTSYLRKGIVGDWKNHFDKNALQALEHHAGGRLEKYQVFVDSGFSRY